MKRTRRIALAWLVCVVLGGMACGTVSHSAPAFDCRSSPISIARADERAIVVVDTSEHSLALCEEGKAVETFSVRIGKNGTGKTHEGDGKTPLGLYGLGAPRPSSAYGRFVPIEYPTEEQARAGFTGGAIGVHGPDRGVRWAGAFVNLFDLTDGCVGIATDAEMARIVEWIRTRNVHAISLK